LKQRGTRTSQEFVR